MGVYHRGIVYSVTNLGKRWKWEINPPDCIRELHAESGEAEDQEKAAAAARKAIEAQTRFMD